MFLDYLKERLGCEIFKTEYGFIAFKIVEDQKACLIHEIFVYPEVRNKKHASDLANFVFDKAKSRGCKFVQCYVDTKSQKPEVSMLSILHYGFKVGPVVGTQLSFYKEVN